jgi:hypothetical protein
VTEESYSPLEALCEAAMRPGNDSVPWGDLLAACVDVAGADAETVRATLELAEPTEAAEPSSERGETLLAEWHGRP